MSKNIGIVGAGSWGTALAMHLAKLGHNVTLWAFLKEEVDAMNQTRVHINLPEAKIPESVVITNDVKETVTGKDIVMLVVPSNKMRENVLNIKDYITKQQVIVNASKGIEEGTLFTMTDVIKDVLPENIVATLSGPSHAEEVSRDIMTTITIATKDKAAAEMLQETFASETFRVYINPDLTGVELGGSLKNIIALAAGISDGMGQGDNAKAALITRGLVEIARIGVAMGSDLRTFYGLSGLGDLIVTCNSMHSRNRRCGILLGEGKTLKEAEEEVKMVVEGVISAKMGLELARKYNISAPIIESINKILFEDSEARKEALDLMTRTMKAEFDAEANMFNVIKWEGAN